MEPREHAQWTLDVTIYHGPTFHHRIKAAVLGRSKGWIPVGTWEWTGLGVPVALVDDLTTRVTATLQEHLITRYGIDDELSKVWESGQGPF